MIELYTKVGSRVLSVPDPFIRFPGGETHMKNEQGFWTGNEIAVVRGHSEWERDLFKLQLWAETVDAQGGTTTALIPYIPGARADRGVPLSGNRYAHMVNLAEISKLYCFDIHSATAHQFYNNLVSIGVEDELVDCIRHRNVSQYHVVIAPDKGATDRARVVASMLGLPLLTATKHRDPGTGELSRFEIDLEGHEEASRFLIVDDICDGGGTFNGLAKVLNRKAKHIAILDLFVTHGIFSKELSALSAQFDNVYTTDTIASAENRSVPQGLGYHLIQLIPDFLQNYA